MWMPPVARIEEPACIGCARCLPVCPTDAIVGSSNVLHTVIVADCTGCGRCIPVCPTDCISMLPRAAETATAREVAARWRIRTRARKSRLAERQREEQEARRRRRSPTAPP